MKSKNYRIVFAFVIYLAGVFLFTAYQYVTTKNMLLSVTDEKLKYAAYSLPSIVGAEYHDDVDKKSSIRRHMLKL